MVKKPHLRKGVSSKEKKKPQMQKGTSRQSREITNAVAQLIISPFHSPESNPRRTFSGLLRKAQHPLPQQLSLQQW